MFVVGIFTGSTEKGIDRFKTYLQALSNKENVMYARIRYNTSHVTEQNAHPLDYPLVVFTKDDLALGLADVAAGYGGTGPQGLVKLLDYLGFDFKEDEILKRQNLVKIDLLKEGCILKDEFKGYHIREIDYLDSPFTLQK